MSNEIGLFYGSTTGMTEDIATRIGQIASEKYSVDLTPINIADLDQPTDIFLYNKLIIGTPTWNYGEHQDDWEMLLPKLSETDLTGKTIALFGLGDQVGYPEYYVDAMGMIWEQFKSQGATFVGEWSVEGYEFTQSKALLDDKHFIGLVIDEDCQPELSDDRITEWLAGVLPKLQA